MEKIWVLLILVLLVFPAIQKETSWVNVKPLDGDYVLAEKPIFNWAEWLQGNFQSGFDKYLEDHIGFRNIFVRITNQIDYSLFNIPRAEGVIICKEKQLIEYDYIRAYTGGDFLGEQMIDKRVRKLKFVQKYLKEEHNIDFVLVFEPSKASFYPEYIPDKYIEKSHSKNNYKTFVQKASDHRIRYIDFNEWFKQMKGTQDYPLYAPYGTHWSLYGMSFAADSLINYIEDIRQVDLNDMSIDSLEIEYTARKPDYDMGSAMNLLFRLPEKEYELFGKHQQNRLTFEM